MVGMKPTIFIFLSLSFFSYSLFAVEKPVFIGKAVQDCKCNTTMFDEEPIAHAIKKNMKVGGLCFDNTDKKETISCSNGNFSSIHCPKNCIELIIQNKLNKNDYVAEVKKVESKARTEYGKIVPRNIYQELQRKFPTWIPVLVNDSDDIRYLTNYIIRQNFYFQVPLKVENKLTEVSIIYFYKSIDELLSNSASWSFWDTNSGELLFEKISPYKSIDGGYVNQPCLAPAGNDLKEVVLYGLMAGPGDAAGCCGPYNLSDVKKSGPQMIAGMQGTEVLDTVTYNLCGKSTDSKSGKYKSLLSLKLIDGPANIRASDSLTSALIGSCSDNALVADLGSKGKWKHVYCEGKLGWTSSSNIRGKN